MPEHLSIYLSVCLPVCLSVCLPVCLSVCLSIIIYLYISIYIYLWWPMNNHEVTQVDLCCFDLLPYQNRSGVVQESQGNFRAMKTSWVRPPFMAYSMSYWNPCMLEKEGWLNIVKSIQKSNMMWQNTWLDILPSLCRKDQPWISPGQAAPANDRLLIQRAEDQPTPSCHLEGCRIPKKSGRITGHNPTWKPTMVLSKADMAFEMAWGVPCEISWNRGSTCA